MPYPMKGAGKRKKLTRKQGKLVAARVLDPDATLDEIGRQAGYNQPRQSAHRELQKPHVQDEVRSLLNERPNLRLGSLMTKLEEGLNATEVRSLKLDGSIVKVSTEVEDFAVRHKYLTSALELHGAIKSEGSVAPSGPINIAIILAGGGSDAEKTAVADALLAARLVRGLSPLENRLMTPEERKGYGLD